MEDSPDKYETPLHIDLDESRLESLRLEFADASSSRSLVHTLLYTREYGETLAVFLNRDSAWLMYRRHEEDAGFSTRNPAYTGPKNAMLPYVLNNGQRDEFPVAGPSLQTRPCMPSSIFCIPAKKLPGWHGMMTISLRNAYERMVNY
jgi:hypothetical protein